MRLGKDYKMGFMDLMKETSDQRKTLTENGAVAYATTGKEILDFNFKLSSFRKMDATKVKNEFGKVYYEDPLTAVKYLYWVGDIREGAGERKVFRSGLLWLAENKPEIKAYGTGATTQSRRGAQTIRR